MFGGGNNWGVTADGHRVSFCDDESILKLVVVMVVQLLMNTLRAIELCTLEE